MSNHIKLCFPSSKEMLCFLETMRLHISNLNNLFFQITKDDSLLLFSNVDSKRRSVSDYPINHKNWNSKKFEANNEIIDQERLKNIKDCYLSNSNKKTPINASELNNDHTLGLEKWNPSNFYLPSYNFSKVVKEYTNSSFCSSKALSLGAIQMNLSKTICGQLKLNKTNELIHQDKKNQSDNSYLELSYKSIFNAESKQCENDYSKCSFTLNDMNNNSIAFYKKIEGHYVSPENIRTNPYSSNLQIINCNIIESKVSNKYPNINKQNELFYEPHKCSINTLLNVYLGAKNLAENTSNLYRLAVKRIFAADVDRPLAELNWSQMKKKIFTFSEEKLLIKRSTFTIYVNCLKSLLKWGYLHEIIERNYFEKYCVESCGTSRTHRQALNCEHFSSIVAAQSAYRKFIGALTRYLVKHKTLNHLKLWLIHSVLCTRRSETIRVIKQYRSDNSVVNIKTKCHDDFPIPVTKEIGILILDIQTWISNLSERTAAEYILRCIPPNYQSLMCAHGTRAIFRTAIELMELKNVSEAAKETYLSHFSTSGIFSSYMRSKLVKQREKLQRIWSAWLGNLLPVKYRSMLIP